jgi:hypothetical protein
MESIFSKVALAALVLREKLLIAASILASSPSQKVLAPVPKEPAIKTPSVVVIIGLLATVPTFNVLEKTSETIFQPTVASIYTNTNPDPSTSIIKSSASDSILLLLRPIVIVLVVA